MIFTGPYRLPHRAQWCLAALDAAECDCLIGRDVEEVCRRIGEIGSDDSSGLGCPPLLSLTLGLSLLIWGGQ